MNGHGRILGCLIGGAIGDAIGAQYEGAGRPDVVAWSGESLLTTDDTQLTLATCEAVVEAGAVDPERIADQFRRYFLQRRIRGIGASTLKALSELAAGGHWYSVGAKGDRAAGNGAAMRVAPLAFCLDPLTESGRGVLRDVCRITHQGDEAYAGALAIVVATRLMSTVDGPGERRLTEAVADSLPDTLVRDRLGELRGRDDLSVLDVAERYGCGGYVVESVPLAILGVERLLADGFECLVTDLIRCGGDTDTIASMAGQIAGAAIGIEGLPQDMVGVLDECDEVVAVGQQFALLESISASFGDCGGDG